MMPKFRVWDKIQDKMFDVEEIKFIYDELVEDTDAVFYYDNKECSRSFLLHDCVTEFMQFTGMFDKNGKEIYEGDVVVTTRFKVRCDDVGGYYEYEHEYKGVVKQLEGCWVIDANDETIELYSDIDEIEIVGHKYMEDYKEFLNG